MTQSNPIPHFRGHGEDVAECVNLEFIEVLVDFGFEEGFELVYAVLDFVFGFFEEGGLC